MHKDENRSAALIVSVMSSFLTPFMGSSINIALPALGRELGANSLTLSWVATAYLLAAAVFLVPFGKLADIYGRKRIFAYGMLLYTVSSFLCGSAGSAGLLILYRALQGMGSAMIFGTGVAILTSVYHAGEKGKVLGINSGAVYIGLSLGPFLGGMLTQQFGWRSIFWVNVPFGLAIIAIVLGRLKGEWAEAAGEEFDYRGALLYALAMVAFIYGLSLLPGNTGILLCAAGLAGGAVFVFRQTRHRFPLVDMQLFFRNAVFAFSNLAALINYSATFAVTFLLSLYLQYIQGLSPLAAGTVLVAQPVIMALGSPFAGRLSDRKEPQLIASAGMAITAASLAALAFLREGSPLSVIGLELALLGLGLALFSSPNTNAVMSSVEKRYYGLASATLGTMRLTGQMFSMAIATFVLSVFLGNVRIGPEHHLALLQSMRVLFAVFALLCTAGIIASLARGKVRPAR